jgi:ABC-type glycerol-3-phosphate transport system substrate-binding protein
VGLVALAGCRAPKPGPPPRPAPKWTGVTVRVQCPPNSPARRLLDSHGRTWARDNGATLELVESGEADIDVIAPVDLPNLAARKAVQPLPDASITAGFLGLYRARLLTWDTATYALPLLGDAVVCMYRADLFGDKANQTAFRDKHHHDLAPPTTWDEFVLQAKFFAERRSKPSLPPLPADDAGLDRQFGVIAAPMTIRAVTSSLRGNVDEDPNRAAVFSFQYDALTGEPRLGSPGFVEALKFLQQCEPLRSTKRSAVDALRDDDAVLAIVTLEELGALAGSGAGKWGIARMPGSSRVFAVGSAPEGFVNMVPYVGSSGALGAVRSGSKAADAAFDLLYFLCNDAISQEIVHNPLLGGGPVRDAHLTRQSAGWFAYGLDEPNTLRLREAVRDIADPRLDNPGIALRIPDQATHRAALVAAIRQTLHDKSDPAAALAAVDQKWRQLDGDPAKARTLYRLSLGF